MLAMLLSPSEIMVVLILALIIGFACGRKLK